MGSSEVKPQLVSVSEADEGQRLDVFLSRQMHGVSRSQVQRLIQQAYVTVDGRTPRASSPVNAGMRIVVQIPPPQPDAPLPEDLPLTILHDDADIVVVDKAAGMVVHPAAGHRGGTLVNALLHHVSGLSGIGGLTRPGIVHRLDKGTSGVMVVAKHDAAHRMLSRQFQDRLVQKTYTALVWGTPDAGRVFDQPIGRDPKHRERISSRGRRTRSASTRIERVEPLDGMSLVDVTIGSGRTHQIRVHLSEAGYPIVGDALYGGRRSRGPYAALVSVGRPLLHARRLSFRHPADGQLVTFESPLAPDLQMVIDRLRRRVADDRTSTTGPAEDSGIEE